MNEPRRIFIVEDNPGDVRLVREALKQQGISYTLQQFTAADAAIRALTECGSNGCEVPDLILLDYNVPRGNGCDMLAAASRNPALAGTPKAILTSSMAAEDRENARRYGAEFIIKPVHLDAFLNEVGGELLRLLQARRSHASSV